MAKVQLKIEVNPNEETEKLGDITNKVDGTGTNSNLSNVSIKANDRGLYKVGEMNSKGRELLSFGEDGNLVFTQSGYLSSNGKDVGMLASEQNPDMFVWGVVPSNKTYNVKLTFTNAQNLKDIVVYGDRVANQFPTEAIIDNDKVIYNDDYRWAINLLTESNTHTIEFTKWNRGDYNACLTLIRVMLRYFDISKDSGLIEVESLSQSNSQPKDIYYGVIPNTGSARVNDIGGEIKDLIDEGIITNSKNNIEIFIDNQKVQHHITTDSDYEDGKVFTMEFENSLSFLETKYAGRNLTDPMTAYALLSEVLGTLGFNSDQVDSMLDKEIVYGDNEIGSVKEYLEKITIEYPYLESATYRETLDKFCVLAQLNLLEDDNGNLKFVSARPIDIESKPIIVIPTNRQFSRLVKDEFLKNKYKSVNINKSKYVGEYQLFGETKSITFLEEDDAIKTDELDDGTKYEYSNYLEVYNNKSINMYADTTTKETRTSRGLIINGYKVKGIKLLISNEYILRNKDTLYINVQMEVKNKLIVLNKDYNQVYTKHWKGTKSANFTWKLDESYSDGQNLSYIENVNIEEGYVTFDLFCPSSIYKDDSGVTAMYTEVYPLNVTLQLYGNVFKIESVSNTDSFDIEINGNELITDENKYMEQSLNNLNKNNILIDYKNGIRTANISVACLDYYDTNGNKVIDWSKQEIVQVGQVVRIDKDNLGNSKVNYINGDPYLWKITGRNFRYKGVPMLDLELQEVNLNNYFLIVENLPKNVNVIYTRISSEYGGSLGIITTNDILYYNDIIRIDYQLKETINYELGNTYVNGKLFKSGDTIVIDENLNILIETNVKKFGINTNIGNGATLYMERISSPYANADLGFINNGDILYYGDVIQLNAKYEGRYEGIIKVNEKRIFNYDRITITSDINVVVETTYNPQTWEIIYEDSTIYEFGFGETTENVNLKLPVNIDFGISREVRFTCEYTVTDSDGNKRILSDVVKELPYEYHPYADSYCNISVALNSSNEILCSRRNGAREIENYNIEYSITKMMLKKIEQHK